jgi:hypothetical protein
VSFSARFACVLAIPLIGFLTPDLLTANGLPQAGIVIFLRSLSRRAPLARFHHER